MERELLHPYPYQPANSLHLSTWIHRYWLQVFLFAISLYILLSKDVSIQMNLNAASSFLSEASSRAVAEKTDKASLAMPALLKEEPSANISTTSQKTTKKTVPIANTFANLTPILSPTYARRKGIDPELVQQKIDLCKNYVRRFAPVALQEMKQFGIPASITLAQGLLESNAGESRLAMESNNHFGIKCRSKCRGCTCRNYADDDIYDMFRVFDSAWESYREHSELLNNARYNHLKKYGNDYKSWAYGLKKAGYATDKRYAEKLIQIIEFLDLDRYDKEAI